MERRPVIHLFLFGDPFNGFFHGRLLQRFFCGNDFLGGFVYSGQVKKGFPEFDE